MQKEYLIKPENSEKFIGKLTDEITKSMRIKPNLKYHKHLEMVVEGMTQYYCQQFMGNREKEINTDEGKQITQWQKEYKEMHKSVAEVEEELKEMDVIAVERKFDR